MDLPNEIIIRILCYLQFADRLEMRLLNKRMDALQLCVPNKWNCIDLKVSCIIGINLPCFLCYGAVQAPFSINMLYLQISSARYELRVSPLNRLIVLPSPLFDLFVQGFRRLALNTQVSRIRIEMQHNPNEV